MKAQNGRDFYDQKGVFEQYVSHRAWKESPNELIEKPVILALLPSELTGSVLDLGCGYGDLAKELLAKGATKYTGVDSSRKMTEFGRALVNDQRATFIQADINQWVYPTASYDLVLSRLVLHYIANLDELFAKITTSLKPGGELIFSVEHPTLTSSIDSHTPNTKKSSWVVDNYFDLGPREQDWLGGRVIKYHRTIEEYWRALTRARFRTECLKEGCPEYDLFATADEFERRKRIPLFLIMKAVKL